MKKNECNTFVKVTNPEKVGEGMNAYVRYTMIVETTDPIFSAPRFEVHRRFREFHALYEKLVDIHRPKGVHIPHPPPKSIKTVAKLKGMNIDPNDDSQIEMRRSSLETFINRLVKIRPLLIDPSVQEFLTSAITTVKARDGLIKFKNNISSTFSGIVPESENFDKWYESKVAAVASLDTNLQKLHSIALDIRTCRKDLFYVTKKFVVALEELRTCEENQSLRTAYESLIKLKEASCALYEKQCLNDVHQLIGTAADYIDDLISVKHLLGQYTKKYSEIRALSSKIEKLKEKNVKLVGAADSTESIALQKQIADQEKLLEFNTKSCEEFYEQMKTSMDEFESMRFSDMKDSIVRYLKTWREIQEQQLKLWEEFLPVCQAIQ